MGSQIKLLTWDVEIMDHEIELVKFFYFLAHKLKVINALLEILFQFVMAIFGVNTNT